MRKTAADSFDDDPDESGVYSEDVFDDEPDVVPCPYCGEDISEMAEWCPNCKSYISREDSPPRRTPKWFVVVAVVLLLILLLGTLFRFSV